MAFDRSQMILAEPVKIETCVFSGHSNMVGDGIDPLDHIASRVNLGHFKTGTLGAMINRALADFFQGTPKALIRSDLIQKDFMVEGELAQYDQNVLPLLGDFETSFGAAVTGTEGSKTIDAYFVGQEENCAENFFGILLTMKYVDCKPLYLGVYKAVNRTEAINFKPSGSEHLSSAFKAQATPDEIVTDTKRNYGLIWKEVA